MNRIQVISLIMLLLICLLLTPIFSIAQLPIDASTTYDSRYLPEYAVDGDNSTRWANIVNTPTPQYYTVDFGEIIPVREITINWEAAYAIDYEIQVSDDNDSWKQLAHEMHGKGGIVTHSDLNGAGRYLRLLFHQHGPFPLFSIWEISSSDEVTQNAFGKLKKKMEEARILEIEKSRQTVQEAFEKFGSTEIVFAVRQPIFDHWYGNFGYYAADVANKCYGLNGAQLNALNVKSGEVRTIFADPGGSIRDPQVHYDGQKILFSYRPASDIHYHLFEINADGSGLKQLTSGDWDDIEPTYLPDDDIMYCSSRAFRWVNCWLTQVATLYRCEGDGGNPRMVSSNIEQDNTPWVLHDGRILYQRWEYVDRSQVDFHHLWTFNPDGTNQMVFFGNMHPGTVMLDAKPLPDNDNILAIFSPGHGYGEHAGAVVELNPKLGPDERQQARYLNPSDQFRDPYPLTQDVYLVARDSMLQVMTSSGFTSTLYTLSGEAVDKGMWLHEPRPLAPRPRERMISDRVDPKVATGKLVLSNVYEGRNMTGVKPGEIKKLLVLETLPKPINYTGGMDPISFGGTFTLERIIGTVPVEEDGSAYFELPALRDFFFVALDENDHAVKRMQSFLTLQPGETTGCVGCHEPRTRTVTPGQRPLATGKNPSRVTPVADVPEIFDFPRDIQPILDRNCIHCHGSEPVITADGHRLGPRAGGVTLTGDRGPMYSHSYYTLSYRKLIADGRNDPIGNRAPRSIGAPASRVWQIATQGHHGVKLSAPDEKMLRYWLESGAAYPGTYGALGSGSIGGYYANNLVETDFDWPEAKAAAEVVDRRCASCHEGNNILPKNLSDERDVSFWRPDWNDPRLRMSRHIVFNLSKPEQSLMLLAPLAKGAGGYGTCLQKQADGIMQPIFKDTTDPDYKILLALIQRGKNRLEEIKRFDMPGFRPPMPYLREMVRYGILAKMPEPDEPVNTYLLDKLYFDSWGWHPQNNIAMK